MKEQDYIALIALFISFASMWLSLNAYRRTNRIEKEEKRRKVVVEIMSIQPRINSILSRARAYVESASEVEKCATAQNSAKMMNEMIAAIEDLKIELSSKYMTKPEKIFVLNEKELERTLTWFAMSNKLLDQFDEKLPSMNQLAKPPDCLANQR